MWRAVSRCIRCTAAGRQHCSRSACKQASARPACSRTHVTLGRNCCGSASILKCWLCARASEHRSSRGREQTTASAICAVSLFACLLTTSLSLSVSLSVRSPTAPCRTFARAYLACRQPRPALEQPLDERDVIEHSQRHERVVQRRARHRQRRTRVRRPAPRRRAGLAGGGPRPADILGIDREARGHHARHQRRVGVLAPPRPCGRCCVALPKLRTEETCKPVSRHIEGGQCGSFREKWICVSLREQPEQKFVRAIGRPNKMERTPTRQLQIDRHSSTTPQQHNHAPQHRQRCGWARARLRIRWVASPACRRSLAHAPP